MLVLSEILDSTPMGYYLSFLIVYTAIARHLLMPSSTSVYVTCRSYIIIITVTAYSLVHVLIARHRIKEHVLLLGKRPFFAPK